MTDNQDPPQRIAVIAVHGVGDSLLGNFAREVAELLQWTHSENNRASSPLSEGRTSVNVTKISNNSYTYETDTKFTNNLLTHNDFEISPKEQIYTTPVYSFSSFHENGSHKATTDIYEMYWADLSRLGAHIYKILGALYQLLFHLPSIGLKTLKHAKIDKHNEKTLQPIIWSVKALEWLLGLVIPASNLVLLAVLAPPILEYLLRIAAGTPPQLMPATISLLAGIFSGAIIYIFAREKNNNQFVEILTPAFKTFLCFMLASAVAYFLTNKFLSPLPNSETIFWYCIFSAICWASVVLITARLIDRRKSDSTKNFPISAILIWGMILISASLSTICIVKDLFLSASNPPNELNALILNRSIESSKNLIFFIELLWLVLLFSLFVQFLLSAWISRINKVDDKTTRALWTAMLGCFIPSSLFLIVTLVLWSALASLAKPAIDMIEMLLKVGGESFFLINISLTISLTISVIALLPSIAAEIWPCDTNSEPAKLGNWLDRGFDAMKFSGLLILSFLIYLFCLKFFYLFPGKNPPQLTLLIGTGSALVSSFIGALLFRRFIFRTLATVIDTALDVDNWLKEKPYKSNPRARILSRYIALLKHISKSNYSRIVIVAHSQGTTITADLFRYLDKNGGLRNSIFPTNSVDIRFATFGSPLFQLYRLRFPHLYGWVEDSTPNNWLKNFNNYRWLNEYRSGDYVGRFLSGIQSNSTYRYDIGASISTGNFTDRCIGYGAHCHYFDYTANGVGKDLNDFIFR